MGLFSRKRTLEKWGLPEGCTDFHSHILPGVDDGVKKLDDSLKILSAYERAGVSRVWLTPHIMEDIPNGTDALKTAFEALCKAYAGKIELKLASENMLDALFEERLASRDFLPLDADCLLVETSYFNPPMDLHGLISKIKEAGYRPVLAHPERYMYMDWKEYELLKSEGVAFQLNIPSLCGAYGETVRKKAEKLLGKGMYDMAGSDLHRPGSFAQMIEERAVSRKTARLLVGLITK